ncbi:MAG TPA: hypothetical protein PK530_17720 [Anaerolineales bacterium]|nr:hypothetical protein [Anaerolineales bacterium]
MRKWNWRLALISILMVLVYGAIVLFVSFKLAEIGSKGYFAWWRSLGKPPEKVQEILDLGTIWSEYEVDVYVKTNTNHIYVHKHDQKEWELTHTYEVLSQFGCSELFDGVEHYPYFSNLPGRVVDCQMVPWSDEWVSHNTYVVLLEDNSLWQWHYKDLNNAFGFLCGGPIVGLVIGLIVVRVVLNRRKLGK